ncbi:MAG TPA: GntR family transcriptional regulator [Hyphomicrobiaceae bacterium]|nr:GntR family transcriptional regulator [Hyphomicrobiaceae bacterium]
MTSSDRDTARHPRYLYVRQRLAERIQSGAWRAGELIPSEFDIAHEFGVSQGTARAAVAALAAERIVARRQGLGTFVYEHTPGEELSRFSCLFDHKQVRINSGSRYGRFVRASADRRERRRLRLGEGSKVLRIGRVRLRGSKPFVVEKISLPDDLFRGLVDRAELPDSLYELYQKAFGVLVVEVEERLSAVTAERSAATALGIAIGTPLLRIERVAVALEDKPVELRVSLCYLADAHYLARLK